MRKRTTSPGGRLMDLRTAAAYLGCSYWTLRDLVLNGHIPAVRIPSPRARDDRIMRRILIDSRDLERLIEAGRRWTIPHRPLCIPSHGGRNHVWA
jgi:excisionase family DNA binding protein